MLIPTNIGVGLAVSLFASLLLLLRNVVRGRPAGFFAACSVILGMFLAYQLALVVSGRYERSHQPRRANGGNPQVKVWAEMRTGLYHCPGDASWGRTTQGKYMTQSEAQRDSFQPARHRLCQ